MSLLGKNTVLGLTTFESKSDAEMLGRELVEQSLAACVQLSGPILSLFNWNDQVYQEEEWQMFIKTTKENIPKIKHWIDSNHPYEEPELLFLEVCDGAASYMKWVADQCGGGHS